MKILVLNCGSSSVKFQMLETDGEIRIAKGLVQKIGESGSSLEYQAVVKTQRKQEIPDHNRAIELVFEELLHPDRGVISAMEDIDGIGHRVVHGGERFSESTLITEEVQEAVRNCSRFAPLHNPPNLKGIEVCSRLSPTLPQVAVFDTAFHHRMPPEAYLYALPYELYEKLGLRRYGFHGTSHRYVARRAARKVLKQPFEQLRLITCHLGNGASVAAVKGGTSVDTSMGFTPLEGLVMGTRCGDLDPAILPFLMEHEKMTPQELDALLNKRSGLLGITGTTNDMREIEEMAQKGSERHALALAMFCRRVKKYIGAYAAVMGGVEAVIFTGGIGENSSRVRELSLEGLEFMGLRVNPALNQAHAELISKEIPPQGVAALVIKTNEELAIARDTAEVVLHGSAAV